MGTNDNGMPERRQHVHDAHPWMNMSPFPEPVNAFLFAAEFMGELAKKHPQIVDKRMIDRIKWLLEMGRLLPWANHTRPVILLALSEAAVDVELRRSMMKILLELDQHAQASPSAQTGGR